MKWLSGFEADLEREMAEWFWCDGSGLEADSKHEVTECLGYKFLQCSGSTHRLKCVFQRRGVWLWMRLTWMSSTALGRAKYAVPFACPSLRACLQHGGVWSWVLLTWIGRLVVRCVCSCGVATAQCLFSETVPGRG